MFLFSPRVISPLPPSHAAFLIGTLTFLTSIRAGIALIAFFLSSSKLTKFAAKTKQEFDAEYKEGGQRTAIQVISNATGATCCCLLWLYTYGTQYSLIDAPLQASFGSIPSLSSLLLAGIIGHYACCTGDTWASEVGPASRGVVRLIIPPFKVVPKGTNGGISLVGTMASLVGGLFIGISVSLVDILWLALGYVAYSQCLTSLMRLTLLGGLCGLMGSFIDSLLGALLQFSGVDTLTHKIANDPNPTHTESDVSMTKSVNAAPRIKHTSGYNILDNHQVNLLSSLLTAIFAIFITYSYLNSYVK